MMATQDWRELERHMKSEQIARSDEKFESLRLGVYIKTMRDNAGLTQTQLAERLQVSQAQISKWETGDGVQFSTLQKVATALDIHIEIIGRSTDHQTVFSTTAS